MGELFEITYERFLDEVRHARLTPGGQNKIEMEDLGNMFSFYLTEVGIDKTYVTVIEKDKITDFQKMNLIPLMQACKKS